MPVSLTKGQNVSLESGLKNVRIALGRKSRVGDGEVFDLDASCFMLTADGKVRSDSDFIFYGQLQSECGSVEHTGDNLIGGGEDDETLIIQLDKVPIDIQKLVFSVTIYEYDKRKQNFGQVSDAYIRIVNDANGEEVVRFDLSEDACTGTAMIFGELYRRDGAWKFRAVGQGFNNGWLDMCKAYGVMQADNSIYSDLLNFKTLFDISFIILVVILVQYLIEFCIAYVPLSKHLFRILALFYILLTLIRFRKTK